MFQNKLDLTGLQDEVSRCTKFFIKDFFSKSGKLDFMES